MYGVRAYGRPGPRAPGAAGRKPLSIAAHGHAHAHKSNWGQITPHFILLVLAAEAAGGPLRTMPDPAQLLSMPVFSATPSPATGLDLLAAAATAPQTEDGSRTPGQLTLPVTSAGPYNPAASLPPKVVRKILNLEFVEMSELTADIWVDEPLSTDTGHPASCTLAKPPVTDIKVWLECFAHMAALLVTCFPEKGPELWAYQTTILRVAHNYEGSNWVVYDRQFRRDKLARKDLNWSSPNARLYNEAFTGRAKTIPRCPHCLCEDHAGANCPHNPNPPVLGWFPSQFPQPIQPLVAQPHSASQRSEVCRNFNEHRCRFARCRFQHICTDCSGPHPALWCPTDLAHQPRPGDPLLEVGLPLVALTAWLIPTSQATTEQPTQKPQRSIRSRLADPRISPHVSALYHGDGLIYIGRLSYSYTCNSMPRDVSRH